MILQASRAVDSSQADIPGQIKGDPAVLEGASGTEVQSPKLAGLCCQAVGEGIKPASIVLILVLRAGKRLNAGDVISIACQQGLSRRIQIDIENEAILYGRTLHSQRGGEKGREKEGREKKKREINASQQHSGLEGGWPALSTFPVDIISHSMYHLPPGSI